MENTTTSTRPIEKDDNITTLDIIGGSSKQTSFAPVIVERDVMPQKMPPMPVSAPAIDAFVQRPRLQEVHQFAAQAVNKTMANAAATSATELLLEMKNMSSKEIGQLRDVRVEEQVKHFCKTKLFHLLKFIVSSSEMNRLKGPGDIGNVVMKGLNVNDVTVQPRWWLLYQDVVKKALDTQRSNCNMAIKLVMVSKYWSHASCERLLLTTTYWFDKCFYTQIH